SKEYQCMNGLEFYQIMNLDTDEARYETLDGKLLMRVTNHGDAYDANDERMGDFSLPIVKNYIGVIRDAWVYTGIDGTRIETESLRLFDVTEPFVIGQLFGTKE